MKYCIFIDIDFCVNAGLFINAVMDKDPEAEFCLLQGTTRNALDSTLAVVSPGARISSEVPDLNELEMEWARSGDASRLPHYEERLGSKVINECQVAGKYMGDGYLQGGRLPWSPLHAAVKDKEAQRRYLAGMLDFFFEYLEREKPDVVFSNCLDRSYLSALATVARHLGLGYRRMLNVRVRDYYTLSSTVREDLPHVVDVYEKYLREGAEPEYLAKADELLEDFRAAPAAPDIQKMALSILHKKYSWRTLLIYLIQALHPTYEPKGKQAAYPSHILKSYFQRRWRFSREYEKPRWKSARDFEGKSFAYYPLHFDPEATTMVYSPMLTNQFAIIEALAKAIPPSWTLAVKEHRSMMGRRPPEFYDALDRLPKVELVHPNDNQFYYLNNTKLIATITGTAALEALVLGKTPLVFGPSMALLVGEGAVQCSDFAALPEAVERALATPPADPEKVRTFWAALLRCSFYVPSPLFCETSAMEMGADEKQGYFDLLAGALVDSIRKTGCWERIEEV